MAPRSSEPPRRLALGFALRFLALVALIASLSRIDLFAFEGAASGVLTRNAAALVSQVFSVVGEDVRRAGNTLYYRGAAFKIIDECTGIEVMALFAAAILAFPSPWRHRGLGLGIGLSALMATNLVRMVTLVWIGTKSRTALEIAHVYVWPVIILTMGLGAWMYWARMANDAANSRP